MSFGNLFVVGPEERGTARQSEVAAQVRIGANPKQFLDVAFREFHDGTKSSTLDFCTSSGLNPISSSVPTCMERLGSRLRAALTARGMTPPDLIARTSLSKATIYFLLDGTTKAEKVRATTIDAICKALNVRREWLLSGSGTMTDAERHAQPTDGRELEDIRLVVGLTARALAATIPTAGRELLDELEHAAGPLERGTFLGIFAEAIRSELPSVRPAAPATRARKRS